MCESEAVFFECIEKMCGPYLAGQARHIGPTRGAERVGHPSVHELGTKENEPLAIQRDLLKRREMPRVGRGGIMHSCLRLVMVVILYKRL